MSTQQPIPSDVNFVPIDSILFDTVTAFMFATVGLGPVFDNENPLKLNPSVVAYYRGRVEPLIQIDTGQIRALVDSGIAQPEPVVDWLCCMTLNVAYSLIEHLNDQTPVFEFLRHTRNAVSHGNRFSFRGHEPKRPAAWRSLAIDHTLKAAANPWQGKRCCSTILAPADVLALLIDVDKLLPTRVPRTL